jgi:hypothetical protein
LNQGNPESSILFKKTADQEEKPLHTLKLLSPNNSSNLMNPFATSHMDTELIQNKDLENKEILKKTPFFRKTSSKEHKNKKRSYSNLDNSFTPNNLNVNKYHLSSR